MPKIKIKKNEPMTFEKFKNKIEKAAVNEDPTKNIKYELAQYEKKYSMSSKEFYELYKNEKLEDTHDYFVWAVKISMLKDIAPQHEVTGFEE